MPRYVDIEPYRKSLEKMADYAEKLIFDIKEDLDEILTAEVVEVRYGKWIKMSDTDGVYWVCSECGEDIPRISHYNPQFGLFPH